MMILLLQLAVAPVGGHYHGTLRDSIPVDFTVAVTPVDVGGRAAYLSATRAVFGDHVIVDSAWTDRATLGPIKQRSHQPTKTMALDFDGRHVTGHVVPTSGPPVDIDYQATGPCYDSNTTSMLLGSLPLADGYRTMRSLYTYEKGGCIASPIVVRRQERGAWVVEVVADHLTYWIDTNTRAMQRMEFADSTHHVILSIDRDR